VFRTLIVRVMAHEALQGVFITGMVRPRVCSRSRVDSLIVCRLVAATALPRRGLPVRITSPLKREWVVHPGRVFYGKNAVQKATQSTPQDTVVSSPEVVEAKPEEIKA
jgi:hypothetical protein